MRVELKKLMERLGVDRVLHPYETQPWVYYDDERGITCSAEVRMGPGREDVEAEIQFFKDDDAPDTTDDESSDGENGENGDGESGNTVLSSLPPGGLKQILLMRAQPTGHGEWSPKYLRINDKDYTNEIYDWEEKGCDFFTSCLQSINMGKIPDIEMMIEKQLGDDDPLGDGSRGRIGRKSPKIKPAQLLGMKK